MIKVGTVVVSAGKASRMGGIDKQNLKINGIPVVVRSISAFESLREISQIVIVTREECVKIMQDYVKKYNFTKVCAIVVGGNSRNDSVQIGINALPEETEYYAIHDGARPFVDSALVKRCVADAVRYGAATAAVKIKDTIKISSADGMIASTPNRDSLYAAQTPQIFRASLYKKAVALAKSSGIDFTDDCQLLEYAGEKVFLSEGSYKNIKITTPEDVALAEILART